MQFVKQTIEQILGAVRPLEVDWKDDTAKRVIARIKALPRKETYEEADVRSLFSGEFDDGLLICRLFLGMSKDTFTGVLMDRLGAGGIRVKRYTKDQAGYVAALIDLGLLDAMAEHTNRKPHWSDILLERLRSGRGSAISGQRRGRELEDFAENIVRSVFGDNFDSRCQFQGKRVQTAKCDIAIPSRDNPMILIEAKGYGATGSKMTDVVGDIDAIIDAKRPDTTLLFFTDGVTWKQRQSDLKKLVDRQNNGEIARIYTREMSEQFEMDLCTLKAQYHI